MDSDSDDEVTGLLHNGHNGHNGYELESQSKPMSVAAAGAASGARPALSLLGVASLSYFSVSGGPFGLEVAIGRGDDIHGDGGAIVGGGRPQNGE